MSDGPFEYIPDEFGPDDEDLTGWVIRGKARLSHNIGLVVGKEGEADRVVYLNKALRAFKTQRVP